MRKPRCLRPTVTTTGGSTTLGNAVNAIQVSNGGSFALRIYFSQADFDATTPYIELAASTGYWEPPGGDFDQNTIWMRGVSGSATPEIMIYEDE